MRSYPDDPYDKEELARLNAEPWMTALLRLNPEYTCWGPHEDYMSKEGDGWDSRRIIESWEKFGWKLDDYNEVVNFYFELERKSKECPTCGGNGYHPDAQWVSESFYRHSSPFKARSPNEEQVGALLARVGLSHADGIHGHRGNFPEDATIAKYGKEFQAFCEAMRAGNGSWSDDLTDDEWAELVKEGRVKEKGELKFGPKFGHDAINRSILVTRRLKRYGVPKTCPACEGHGHVYTAPKAHVNLVLWVLHPRKGASRGVEIGGIRRGQLPAIFRYLSEAAKRNAGRFARVVAKARRSEKAKT
jgi:hypothetical protein